MSLILHLRKTAGAFSLFSTSFRERLAAGFVTTTRCLQPTPVCEIETTFLWLDVAAETKRFLLKVLSYSALK